jgi:hypothetical protein
MRLTVRAKVQSALLEAEKESNNWRYYFQVRKTFLSLGYSEPYRTRGLTFRSSFLFEISYIGGWMKA